MDIPNDTPDRIRHLARDIFGESPEARWLEMREIHQYNPGASKEEALEILAIEQFGWLY